MPKVKFDKVNKKERQYTHTHTYAHAVETEEKKNESCHLISKETRGKSQFTLFIAFYNAGKRSRACDIVV